MEKAEKEGPPAEGGDHLGKTWALSDPGKRERREGGKKRYQDAIY